MFGRCLSIFQALSFLGVSPSAEWIWGALSNIVSAGLAPALLAASAWLLAALVTLRIFAPMPQIGEGAVASGRRHDASGVAILVAEEVGLTVNLPRCARTIP